MKIWLFLDEALTYGDVWPGDEVIIEKLAVPVNRSSYIWKRVGCDDIEDKWPSPE